MWSLAVSPHTEHSTFRMNFGLRRRDSSPFLSSSSLGKVILFNSWILTLFDSQQNFDSNSTNKFSRNLTQHLSLWNNENTDHTSSKIDLLYKSFNELLFNDLLASKWEFIQLLCTVQAASREKLTVHSADNFFHRKFGLQQDCSVNCPIWETPINRFKLRLVKSRSGISKVVRNSRFWAHHCVLQAERQAQLA